MLACSMGTGEEAPSGDGDGSVLREVVMPVVVSSNDLGSEWIRDSLAQSPDGNVICAPFPVVSISAALARGAEGKARDQLWGLAAKGVCRDGKLPDSFEEGDYLSQIGKMDKHLSTLSRGYIHISDLYFSNLLKVNADYKKSVEGNLGMKYIPTNFGAGAEKCLRRINERITGQTKGFIRNFLPAEAVTEESRMVMVDIMGFVSQWANPFDPEKTKSGEFFTGGGKVSCPFMKKDMFLSFREKEDYILLWLHYARSAAVFMVVLPKEGISLEEFVKGEGRLSCGKYLELLRSPQKEYEHRPDEVKQLYFPRFSLTTPTEDLVPFFKSKGVTECFNSESRPLSRMFSSPGCVRNMYQKNFMRVDERGSISFAAAAAEAAFGGPGENIIRVNRPFLFFIADTETDMALFMGAIRNPVE